MGQIVISILLIHSSISHFAINTANLSSDLAAYLQSEVALTSQRQRDCLSILIEQLLLFYCPPQQVAYCLVVELITLPSCGCLRPILHQLLHERKEFDQCGKLVPQQQMR